jgi:hypothetical protein
MPAYNSQVFRPPAPVASVSVRSLTTGRTISNIPLLIDSGADVSFLPRDPIADLISVSEETLQYEVESFDGTKSLAPVVQMELLFLCKSFRGQFLLVDAPYGFLGRNILNKIRLLLDGPSLHWENPQHGV